MYAGESYGKKILTGALQSKGILVNGTKFENILREINPNTQEARQYSAGRFLNPKVHKADYFGHKSIIIKTKSGECMAYCMYVLEMVIQGRSLAILRWQRKTTLSYTITYTSNTPFCYVIHTEPVIIDDGQEKAKKQN